MKLFTLKELENYVEFVEYLTSQDQPLFIYSPEEDNNILVSEIELENPLEKIEEILDEVQKPKTTAKPDIWDEVIWDDLDDMDDWLLFM